MATVEELPGFISRVAKHLMVERGYPPEKAVNIAIMTARRFCERGTSPNLPGHPSVNLGTRAEACAAVAELDGKKPAPPPKGATPSPGEEPDTQPETKPKEEPVADSVSHASWDGSPARFSDEQYRRSCLIERPGDGPIKSRCSLPVREPDGRLNEQAVHSAVAALLGARGGLKGVSHSLIVSAAKKLVALLRQLGKEPPDGLLKLAGMAAAAGAAEARTLTGEVEERSAPDVTVEGRKLRGVVPYETRSRDLGGWSEVMRRGCIAQADTADLVCTVDHSGVPLGRFPGTLTLEERDDGVHWAVDVPQSRPEIVEAVERGDLRSCSWRMIVGRDSWSGNTRYVEEVRSLRDVSLVTTSAYEARAELRAVDETEEVMEVEETAVEETAEQDEEDRSAGGSLRVEQRTERGDAEGRSLHDMFRRAGWTPEQRASISFGEYAGSDENRGLTLDDATTASDVAPIRREGVGLGFDNRYAWPAFAQASVDSGTTAVQVMRQTARALPAPGEVIRPIDATVPKPEVGSSITVESLPMAQVAAIQAGVPNVYLESNMIRTILGADLRIAINEGLDELVLAGVAEAGFQPPGSDALLVSIRKCITTIQAAGYAPNLLVLRPADSEALDVLTSEGPEAIYTFGPGRFAPGSLFGLTVRVSKSAAAPFVADSSSFGRLYASPLSLATFEENSGSTNTSTMRLEGSAQFGVERADAAIRIAAA